VESGAAEGDEGSRTARRGGAGRRGTGIMIIKRGLEADPDWTDGGEGVGVPGLFRPILVAMGKNCQQIVINFKSSFSVGPTGPQPASTIVSPISHHRPRCANRIPPIHCWQLIGHVTKIKQGTPTEASGGKHRRPATTVLMNRMLLNSATPKSPEPVRLLPVFY
jgi:hypothetical protein